MNDQQFRFLFLFAKHIEAEQSAENNDLKELLAKVAENNVNCSGIIRKANIPKLVKQKLTKCTIQNMKNLLNQNYDFQQKLDQIITLFTNEFRRELQKLYDKVRPKDGSKELTQTLTKHYDESFKSYDDQISGWRDNQTNIKQVDDIYLKKDDVDITATDISSLHSKYGMTGSRYVKELKALLIKKHFEKIEAERKQKIMDIGVELKDYEQIAAVLGGCTSKALNMAIDDLLKKEANSFNSDWIDGYKNTTNNFMDAMQSYYQKKSCSHMR